MKAPWGEGELLNLNFRQWMMDKVFTFSFRNLNETGYILFYRLKARIGALFLQILDLVKWNLQGICFQKFSVEEVGISLALYCCNVWHWWDFFQKCNY